MRILKSLCLNVYIESQNKIRKAIVLPIIVVGPIIENASTLASLLISIVSYSKTRNYYLVFTLDTRKQIEVPIVSARPESKEDELNEKKNFSD